VMALTPGPPHKKQAAVTTGQAGQPDSLRDGLRLYRDSTGTGAFLPPSPADDLANLASASGGQDTRLTPVSPDKFVRSVQSASIGHPRPQIVTESADRKLLFIEEGCAEKHGF